VVYLTDLWCDIARSLQQSVFTILNGIVRSGPQPREAVLDYFARALQLNLKRGGMHVDPATVASDGFMINLQSALLRFAEPFLDANFSKVLALACLAHSTKPLTE
jgi:ubiquitin conjugation factor E4 B